MSGWVAGGEPAGESAQRRSAGRRRGRRAPAWQVLSQVNLVLEEFAARFRARAAVDMMYVMGPGQCGPGPGTRPRTGRTAGTTAPARRRGRVEQPRRASRGPLRACRSGQTLHLSGPRAARVERLRALEGIDRETAERRQEAEDRARAREVRDVRDVYGGDPSLYHLMIDSTALDLDTCSACRGESLCAASCPGRSTMISVPMTAVTRGPEDCSGRFGGWSVRPCPRSFGWFGLCVVLRCARPQR
jgi:hypothetical protein